MNTPAYQPFGISGWQDVYLAAVAETDIGKMFRLVEIAEPILLLRRDALKSLQESETELSAIEYALLTLSIIKKYRLDFGPQSDLD